MTRISKKSLDCNLKKCSNCRSYRPLKGGTGFNGRKSCASCLQKWRTYYFKNRKKCCDYRKVYYRLNPEKEKRNTLAWRAKNPELVKIYNRNCYLNTEKPNPNFRIQNSVRSRVWLVLCGKSKSLSIAKLMGGVEEYRKRVESTWRPGWGWGNFGIVWQIDHIKPLCRFDLENPEEFKKAFHWSNVQALSVHDNLSKGGKEI